jgi:ribosomal protein S18 acetylase RimI-like enzyme
MIAFLSTHSTPSVTSTTFRAATVEDCFTIAQLFQIAADGVADYIWNTLQPEYPGLSPLQIGATRYANPDSVFSYKNAVLAEQNGQVVGMMLSFPIEPSESDAGSENQLDSTTPAVTFPEQSSETEVMTPYGLEAPGTWYICALAVFPEYRGQGIGSQFLQLAHQQAAQRGFSDLSLLCFEQNVGALRLYQRHGFREIARVPVVPHPFIHFTGDLLLLTTPVQA